MPRVIPGPPASAKSSKCIALAARHGRLYLGFITAHAAFIFEDCTELVQIIESPFATEHLDCIAFDRRTGRLALSSGSNVRIYDELYTFTPRPGRSETDIDEVSIKWIYARSTTVSGTAIKSLSWGLGGELLVGNDRLSLYHQSSQTGELRSTWNFLLASEVETAIFSPDASLIASHGVHDRLVKIWRRLSDRVTSTGAKTSDFDFIYLSHPRLVDDIKWRQPFHEDLLVDNIMYSTSIDQTFRAWASDIPHDSHLLTLHESVSLECDYDSSRKIAVVLDDDVFSWALSNALKRHHLDQDQLKARQVLATISAGQPEVVLTISIDGSLDAYALHNLGSRNDKRSTQQHFFRTSGLNILTSQETTEDVWITAEISRSGAHDLILFVGRPDSITVYKVRLFDLFSTIPKIETAAFLGGHRAVIKKLAIDEEGLLLTQDVSDSQPRRWQKVAHEFDLIEPVSSQACKERKAASLPKLVEENLVEDVVLSAVADVASAVVLSSNKKQVQIWGDQLVTKFSGSPESRIDCQSNITALCWSRAQEDRRLLAVCTQAEIMLIESGTVVGTGRQIWSSVWFFSLDSITKESIVFAKFLQDNLLVIAAGAQLYTFSSKASASSSIQTLPKLHHGELQVYHPTFLIQLLRLGKLNGARKILGSLHDQLISLSDSSQLAEDLDLSDDAIFASEGLTRSQKTNGAGRYSALFGQPSAIESTSSSLLSESKAKSLQALLKELSIPGIDNLAKEELDVLISALVKIEADETSLDRMGQQFYLSYAIMQARREENQDNKLPSLSDEDVLWATKSEKQDILLTLVKSSVRSLTWEVAKAARIFLWLRDRTALLEVAETVAKAEFLKGESRDPVAASIWYHALGKKNTLLSLWRTSGTHPEHNLTTKILANDFTQAKWRTAANKNAYALIGRRRFQYAAAWFLLAGSLKDAAQLCIRNVEDLDLAFAIARLWADGEDPMIASLLAENYTDMAKVSGSRLLACWTSDFRSQYGVSMQTITRPFSQNTQDSPAILQAYEDLRERQGPCQEEREFIDYIAYLLDVRGCKKLSRHLLQTWIYKEPTDIGTKVPEVVTLAEYKAAKKETLSEAPQAVYQEPTMDSFAAFDF